MKNLKQTSLALLCETAGLSFSQLADISGVSHSLITKINSGHSKAGKGGFSQKTLEKISNSTGVSIESLLNPNGSKLKNIFGEPYTKEFFEEWRFQGSTHEEKKRLIKDNVEILTALNKAALDLDHQRNFEDFFQNFIDSILSLDEADGGTRIKDKAVGYLAEAVKPDFEKILRSDTHAAGKTFLKANEIEELSSKLAKNLALTRLLTNSHNHKKPNKNNE